MSEFLDKAPQNVVKLVELIKGLIKESVFNGHVYLVGGVVRDVLLGKDSVNDVDMVIDVPDGGIGFATWLAYHTGCHITNKNPCIFPTYGTAKVQILNNPDVAGIEIECVQTRKEKYNKDSRSPSQVFGSIQEDAMRRDLTINAIYYNITEDKICDFTGRGLDDLKNQILRCSAY